MSEFFSLAYSAAIIVLVVGLIKPTAVIRWGMVKTRTAVFLYYFLFANLFAMFGLLFSTTPAGKNRIFISLALNVVLAVSLRLYVKKQFQRDRPQPEKREYFSPVKKKVSAKWNKRNEKALAKMKSATPQATTTKRPPEHERAFLRRLSNEAKTAHERNEYFPIEAEHIVQSFSDPTIEYTVNTENLTCTCPNFDTRKYRSKKDPKRLCKHLIQVLNQEGREEGEATGLDFITGTVCCRPIQVRLKADKEWVDVTYDGERHGYHLERGYWTHSARELPEFQELDRWIKENAP